MLIGIVGGHKVELNSMEGLVMPEKEVLESLSLERIADGSVPLVFLEVLSEKILPNIFDPSTDQTKERSMAIEIKFKPTTDRYGEVTGMDIIVEDPKVKLAPRKAIEAHALLGKVGDQFQAKEIRQMTIDEPDVKEESGNKPLKAVK